MAKSKKTFRKRIFRRRKFHKKITNKQTAGFMGNGQALLTINKGLGFPLRFRTKLRYVERTAITSTSGVLAIQNYRANGCYDPNAALAGHQPMYFDQLTTVYNYFKVIGSKITVELVPQGTSIQTPVYLALWTDEDGNYTGSFSQAIELGLLRNYVVIGGNARNTRSRLTYNWSLKKTFKDIYNASSVTGSGAADPAQQTYYMIGFQPVDSSTTTSYSMLVTIDYIVDFFELRDVGQS